jgi:phosphatidylinositol alpha 1,6-mannosyltransferase
VRLRNGEAPRILFCTDTYPPQVNGVSVVTALSVAGVQERGWEVGVVAPRYPKPYGKPFASDAGSLASVKAELRLSSVAMPTYPDIRASAPHYGGIVHLIDSFRPHLVHCETEFLIGRMGQLAAAHRRVPLVSSYHTDFSKYTEKYGAPWLRGIVTGYLARFHRRSRRVYTPSEHARDDLHRIGVRNVEVWGRGVDVDQFNPSMWSSALREQLHVTDDFVFLHVGRLAAEKNVELVIDAFRLFTERQPAVRASLVIAGDGPVAGALRDRAADLPRVLFLGNLERHLMLPLLYASADAFLYASETETLGLVVLEAMASGVPVIATPAGGVADNLRDDQNGIAFPAGDANAMCDAMTRVVTQEPLRRRLGDGARRWAESRSWRAELDRLDESYREVALANPQPHHDQAVTATS